MDALYYGAPSAECLKAQRLSRQQNLFYGISKEFVILYTSEIEHTWLPLEVVRIVDYHSPPTIAFIQESTIDHP